MFIVFVKNNRPSRISRLASLSVGLTAGTYRNSEYIKIMRFFSLLVLYALCSPSTGPLLLVKIMCIVFKFLR